MCIYVNTIAVIYSLRKTSYTPGPDTPLLGGAPRRHNTQSKNSIPKDQRIENQRNAFKKRFDR